MKVIEHRWNNPWYSAGGKKVQTPFAEIDVHLMGRRKLVVKHDVMEEGIPVTQFLRRMPKEIDQYLVDIKQNLSVENLRCIKNAFGSKFLGFIDVPWPAMHEALTHMPEDVYARVSEFEPACGRYRKIWLDPLISWTEDKYYKLLNNTAEYQKVMVACPTLHGGSAEDDLNVMSSLIEADEFYQIEGCVTKAAGKMVEMLGEKCLTL